MTRYIEMLKVLSAKSIEIGRMCGTEQECVLDGVLNKDIMENLVATISNFFATYECEFEMSCVESLYCDLREQNNLSDDIKQLLKSIEQFIRFNGTFAGQHYKLVGQLKLVILLATDETGDIDAFCRKLLTHTIHENHKWDVKSTLRDEEYERKKIDDNVNKISESFHLLSRYNTLQKEIKETMEALDELNCVLSNMESELAKRPIERSIRNFTENLYFQQSGMMHIKKKIAEFTTNC